MEYLFLTAPTIYDFGETSQFHTRWLGLVALKIKSQRFEQGLGKKSKRIFFLKVGIELYSYLDFSKAWLGTSLIAYSALEQLTANSMQI
jgi:hypothetical protein